MKVGIDARTFSIQGGSRTYAYNLIQYLRKQDIELVLYGDENKTPVREWFRSSIPRILWENTVLPYASHRDEVDIFHGIKHVVPYYSSCPRVVTVHDLAPLVLNYRFEDEFYLRVWEKYVQQAEHIIAISESTKADLQTYFDIPPENITVIHHGVHPKFFDAHTDHKRVEEFLHSQAIDVDGLGHTVLSVGTIIPKKNYKRLFEALGQLLESGIDIDLLVAGRKGWGSENIIEYKQQLPYSDRIHLLGFVPEDILPPLYRYSDLFAYVPKYEGFGLPPLEAMASEVPVVTSDTSSLPEVVGNAAITINPSDTGAIAAGIKKGLFDDDERDDLRRSGIRRAREFRWEDTASETADVYDMVYREVI